MQGEKKRKQEMAMAMGNAEANRYSPWTGVHNKIEGPTSDGFSSGLQGGLSGAMLMQGYKPGAEAATTAAAEPSQIQQMSAKNTEAFNTGDYNDMQGLETSAMPRRRYSYWG
jgi:hypothetical protein